MSRIDLPGYGIATTPDYPPTVACIYCRGDEIPLDDDGRCGSCAPTEDETTTDWAARLGCRCTDRYDAPGAYASGYCAQHGVAWQTRGGR